MIRKIGESFKITEIRGTQVRRVKIRLKRSEWRTLKVERDSFQRRVCGNCGMSNRPDIYSVQAGPEGVWICDECAAKFCPELLSEAVRLREEGYERDWGVSKEDQRKWHRFQQGLEGPTFPARIPGMEAGAVPPPNK